MAFNVKTFRFSYWMGMSILLATYFFMAKLGLKNGFPAHLYFPDGIAFAALFLFGYRLWPVVTISSFLISFWGEVPLFVATGIAVGHTLQAMVGAFFFRKVAESDTSLEKIKDVLALVILVSAISTLIGATVGVASLLFGGVISFELFTLTWRGWWIASSLNILVIAPLVLVWRKPPQMPSTFSGWLEVIAFCLSTVILSLLIFGPFLHLEVHKYFRPYLFFPFLIWTTLRFGSHTNTMFVWIVSTIAVWGTLSGYGFYKYFPEEYGVLLLQLFIGVLSIICHFFGALRCEKKNALSLRADFISIASHELRTPITSLGLQIRILKGYLDTNLSGQDAEKILKIASSADKQINRLGKLVDSLLDTTQIESGNLKINRKEMDLSILIAEVAESFRDRMLEVSCNLELNLEPSVKGSWDQYRLEQVITNLLMNSLKYGAGKSVAVTLSRAGTMASFSVQDCGIGIAEKYQSRIFNRFERIRDRDSGGLGLGLYISKQIVEAHKGKIFVESELGRGSVFVVELPLKF